MAAGESRGDAEPDHRQTPHDDRGDDRQPLALNTRQPAREHAARDRTHRDGGRQQRHRGAALDRAPEAFMGHLREERPRHTEDHGVKSTTNDINTTVLPAR